MEKVLFCICLYVINFVLIFVAKLVMYKLFKCKNYKKNLYFSTAIFTIFSYVMFVLLMCVVSLGDRFQLSSNLSSFSLVYLSSLLICILLNFVFEKIIYKNDKYVYKKGKMKKTGKIKKKS